MKGCNQKFKEWQYYKLAITSRNKDNDDEMMIDAMTWRQWLNNALKRTHGLFGEGIEYYILNQTNRIAYMKVTFNDKDIFESAIATYTSSDELVGAPLIVSILQATPDLKNLDITKDDELWLKRAMEDETDTKCT